MNDGYVEIIDDVAGIRRVLAGRVIFQSGYAAGGAGTRRARAESVSYGTFTRRSRFRLGRMAVLAKSCEGG
jgi:hypothetical protein